MPRTGAGHGERGRHDRPSRGFRGQLPGDARRRSWPRPAAGVMPTLPPRRRPTTPAGRSPPRDRRKTIRRRPSQHGIRFRAVQAVSRRSNQTVDRQPSRSAAALARRARQPRPRCRAPAAPLPERPLPPPGPELADLAFRRARARPNGRSARRSISRPRLEFVETPLKDVVDYLKDLHHIEIQLDSAGAQGSGRRRIDAGDQEPQGHFAPLGPEIAAGRAAVEIRHSQRSALDHQSRPRPKATSTW